MARPPAVAVDLGQLAAGVLLLAIVPEGMNSLAILTASVHVAAQVAAQVQDDVVLPAAIALARAASNCELAGSLMPLTWM